MNTSRILVLFVFVLILAKTNGQTHLHNHNASIEQLQFIENKGQWHEQPKFKSDLNGGQVWLEPGGFTYNFLKPEHVARMHEENHTGRPYSATSTIDGHVFRMKFVQSNTPEIQGAKKQSVYHNYFLGNDRSAWVSKAGVFHEVMYTNLYEGIGLSAYSHAGHFKYDYHVSCLLYTSPSPRDRTRSRMPSSA